MGLFDLSDISADNLEKSVEVESYRYDFFSTGRVLVYKGSNEEPSYEVTLTGCTCPGDRYSSNPCKHRKAVSSLGDGSAVPPEEGTAVRTKEGPISLDSEDLDDFFE